MAVSFDENAPVLEITDLNLSYWTRAGEIPAVIDFSLTVQKGESIGLVGESGCGKSTVAMAIMQYMGNNGTIKSGSIRFKGVELTELPPDELRKLRGSHISMIYQEPFAALNPSLTLGTQLKEVPTTHENISDSEAWERAVQGAHRRAASRPGTGHGGVPAPRSPAASSSGWSSRWPCSRTPRCCSSTSRPRPSTSPSKPASPSSSPTSAASTAPRRSTSRTTSASSWRSATGSSSCTPARWSRKAPSTPCSRGRSIPTPTDCSAAFPCRRRTRTRPPSSPSPDNCLSRTNGRADATSAPAATSSRTGAATRRDVAMESVAGTAMSDHRVRCVRWREIDHGMEVAHGEAKGPDGDRGRGPRGGRHAEVLRGP